MFLAAELARRGWNVTALAPVGDPQRSAQLHQAFRFIDMKAGTLSSVRVFRRAAAMVRVFLLSVRSDLLVVVEPGFAGVAIVAKMFRPSLRYIQSCGEMYERSEGHSVLERLLLQWSSRHWNGLIDVEDNRRRHRQSESGFSGPSWVIPNTLGRSQFTRVDSKRRTPVVAYVGNIAANVDVPRLVSCLAQSSEPFFFVAFVHASENDIASLQRLADTAIGAGRASVRQAVPQHELHAWLVREADIGLVHYPLAAGGISQQWSAAGKVFDYLRAGMPFVGTANPPLQELAHRGFGYAPQIDDEAGFTAQLDQAIHDWRSGRIDPASIQRAFDRELCSEVFVGAAADQVEDLIGSTPT
jgi:glycosyltransferase involved in cell wall biosynthesis